MSASAEQALCARLVDVQVARRSLDAAKFNERTTMVLFMAEALHQGWPWTRIGDVLEISATAARRYYERNRMKVTAGAAA